MYGGDGATRRDQEDAIDRLVVAICDVQNRKRPATPSAVRRDLIRLRRASDLLEMEFSHVASAFAETNCDEWQGYLSPVHWMRRECGMTAAAAGNAVCVGEQAPALPLSVQAVANGTLGFAHLALIARTARALRESPTATKFDEQPLLDQALNHNLTRFRDDCAHVRHAHDSGAFLAEQAQDVEYRTLEVRAGEGGAVFVHGFLDPVGGATLRTALDPLARRAGSDDRRARERRYADALVELAAHSLDAGLVPRAGGQQPHLQVTTSVETLTGTPGAPAGTCEFAGVIATATVQRLACDASVTRVVMGPGSTVLDVGRAQRLPTAPTRRALRARDQGCAWPGCDRPAAWTVAHHLVHWAHGGATDLDNLVLICHRHHWMIHEGGWNLLRGDDRRMIAVAPTAGVVGRARGPDDVIKE